MSGSLLIDWWNGLTDEERAAQDGGTRADVWHEMKKYGVLPCAPSVAETLTRYEQEHRMEQW